MNVSRKSATVALLAAVLGLGACNTLMPSTTVQLNANLSGSSEVPPNASTGSGTVQASLDKQTNVLKWTVTYSGLSGPLKAAHFHGPAAVGQNAPVAQGFSGNLESPFQGSATLTAAQVADVLAGKWYANLHTAAHPGGEIRGQLVPAP